MGDLANFTNYYNFTDSVTTNTMLIHVGSQGVNSDNIALVTCASFFEDNRLVFTANTSASVNIWTNLGQPTSSTGVWNSQNCTTTLTLDASSVAEISWNSGTSPVASHLSAASTVAGNTTTFTVLWSDDQSLSGGGYIFSTNNTGQWINASWASFNSNPNWGNISLTLNDAVGVVVGFREYANNSLNLWGDSGIYAITTTSSTDTPTSTPSPTLTPTPTSTPPPTTTPTPSPVSTPPLQSSLLSTEAILTVTIALLVLVVVFVMAFKKGYISIEKIEEKPEEST
jgi:hypothetical protein